MKRTIYLFGLFILGVLIFIASGIRFDVPVEKLKAKYTNAQSKFITIDGLPVHYRDEGKGFPLVLLHGAPSSLHSFDGLTAELSRHYRVIRLDLPGYGLTGPTASGDYSLAWYVRFLDSFLTALHVDTCYLAGHSFGGRLAAEFAYTNKNRARKLVLIASSGYPIKNDGVLAVKMARNPLLRPIVRNVTPRFFIAMNLKEAFGASAAIPDETIDRYYDLLLRSGNRDTFIAMCNQEPEDITSHIASLNMPTLILWGSADSIVPPRHAEFFHKDIPGSRVIVYDGAGHMPQEEVPGRVAADMRAFLR
ncbi:MAG TPA: alpha/beta hydrolase [Nitrospirota bacterium]|nr:alpha/beta hydrolase [Nitrospirota bacterium]